MLSLDEIRARKTPNVTEVRIVLDAEWGARYSELENRATQLDFMQGEKYDREQAEAVEQLEKMRAELDDHTVVFRFKAVSSDRYERLMRAHPAPKDQRETEKSRGERVTPWDEKTFPIALVAACSLEPVMTEDDVRDLFNDEGFNPAEASAMFAACLQVCTTRPTITR